MINKKFRKRLSAVLLASALCISAVPGNVAYATEAEGTETTVESTESTATEAEGTEIVAETTESSEAEVEGTETATTEAEGTETATETTENDTTTETTDELADDFIIPNDETGIPDTVLYNYLVNAEVYRSGQEGIADVNGDGKLSVGEAKEIYDLQLYDIEGDEDRIRTFKNVSKYVPKLGSFLVYDYADTPGEHMTLSTADIEEFAKLQETSGRGFDLTLRGVLLENPADLTKLHTLEGFDISESNLTNLDFVTKENFPNLRYFCVRKNPIEKLPASISEFTELWDLEVSDCKLTALPDISGLTDLEILDVSGNQLTALPDISGLTKLKRLYADDNQLTALPDISGLVNLELLWVSDNQLTTLPDLTALTKLEPGVYDNFASNLLPEAELKAKLPAQFTEDIIKEILHYQITELICTVSVDKTKITKNDVVTATVTVKNNCVMPIQDVKVHLAINGGIHAGTPEGYESDPVIANMAVGEEVSLTYKIDGQLLVNFNDPETGVYLMAAASSPTGHNNSSEAAKTEPFEVEETEEDNNGTGDNNGSDNNGTGDNNASDNNGTGDNNNGSNDSNNETAALDIKVTDITVANKDIVLTDDAPTGKISLTVAVDGADVAKLANGDRLYAYLRYEQESMGTIYLNYNAETKKFEGSTNIGGNTYFDGTYSVDMFRLESNWQEISYTGDAAQFTLKNNVTDKVSPVVNGVEILINGVAQTANKFTLKAGDVVTVRADVTDDSQILGMVQLYPDFEASKITTAQYIEMSNAGNLSLTMRAGQYDLEVTKTLAEPFYEGEYQIYCFLAYDKNMNMTTYYADALAPFLKTVAPNKANAVVVENEATTKDLNKVAANIATIIAKDGAVDAATKAKVEAAIKNGETISVDLTYSNVPANSVSSKVKAEAEKKADAVFGKDTKLVYLDIAMTMTASKSGALGNLKELGEAISITVKLPEGLEAYKYFKVVRSHEKADGTVETTIIDAVKNADGTITFKTDRFSTYAIAYSNTAPIGESGGTGDADMTLVYLALAVSAVAAVVVCKKTRKAA